MKTKGIEKASVIVVTCSKCGELFTDNVDLTQTCYNSVKEATGALIDWGWIIKDKKVLCENCQ